MEYFSLIPYPGDDGNVEELIKYYHQKMYTEDEIRVFFLFRHNVNLSRSKFRRYKRKLGLRKNNVEATTEEIVLTIHALFQKGFVDFGYKSFWRVINVSCGIRVTQETVRRALQLMDPVGVALRSRNRLRRRRYQSQGPNFIVHMDGYDKLKPFGFSIHGCVDGFSRKVLWLKVLRSNKNPYVVSKCYFDYLLKSKRLPMTVRCDAGTENVVVCDVHRALINSADELSNNLSVLIGRSTANQRIEMFWGVLKKNFTQHWRNFFQDMQDCGLLNTASSDEMEALRLWFTPVIQNHLDIFAEHWNNHRIRSQRDTERLSGAVPEILYHQPELFGAVNCSIAIPCNDRDLIQLSSLFSVSEPQYGCTDDFLRGF